MAARVAVVGSLNMDLIARAPRIPQPGETILGGDFCTAPGGKGANQAVAAARLGAQVSMVGRVGSDAFAQTLLASLAAAGVDHRHVIQDAQAATGVALIVVDDRGQNSIVVAPGANARLSPADVDAARAAIAAAGVLLLQLESPLEAVARAAELAHAHGVTVVLNPAPARKLPTALLALVDVLVPNESETAILAGLPDGVQVEAQAMALLDLGVGAALLTLGERGALLAQPGSIEHVPAFRVTPVDTTAAGDAFVGGFAAALAEGRSPVEAVRWGCAAGALATTKLGAQPSLPTRQEVEALLKRGN
ncbi:MAG: ribokinase [Anaerolineae bacterium]|nr:ribokinase [Anaerolineae bacterium]